MEKMTQVRRELVGKSIEVYDSFYGCSDKMKIKDVRKRRNGCYELIGEKRTMMVEDDTVHKLIEGRKKYESNMVDHCRVTKEWSLTD